MTAKRFTRDEHTGYLYNNGEIVEDVMKLLNELNKENEQLKKELDKLKLVNEMLSMDFSNSEHELYRENEQLKQQLKELKEDVPLLLAFYRWYPFAVEKKEHQAYNRLWDFVND